MLPNVDSLILQLEALGYTTGSINDRLAAFLRTTTGLNTDVNHLLYEYLGSRGYTGALQDRIYSFVVDGMLLTVPTVSCALPFDATQATLQGYGFTGRLTLSNADQTFSYTTQGGLGSTQVWAAGPATLGTYDASTGTLVCEWTLDHEPNLTGGAIGDLIQQALVFYTGAFAEAFKITVSYQPSGKTVGVYIGGASVYSASTTDTRFGIEMNAVDSTVRVYGTNGVELPLGGTLSPITAQALTPVVQIAEASGLTISGQTVGSSFVSAATSYQYAYAFDATDTCSTAISSADPRWADVLMLVDFTSQSGATTVTDIKNGDVYTMRGTANVSEGQLVMNGAGYADTPDSTYHDPGASPDTIEFLGFEVTGLTAGYQCVASNYDGTNTTFTLQRYGDDLIVTLETGSQYTFTNAAGGAGWVIGKHYNLALTRTTDGVLNLWVNGAKHATEYTGITASITGSVSKWTFGGFPAATGIGRYFEGRLRAFRMTDGAPRYTSAHTPLANFPHNG